MVVGNSLSSKNRIAPGKRRSLKLHGSERRHLYARVGGACSCGRAARRPCRKHTSLPRKSSCGATRFAGDRAAGGGRRDDKACFLRVRPACFPVAAPHEPRYARRESLRMRRSGSTLRTGGAESTPACRTWGRPRDAHAVRGPPKTNPGAAACAPLLVTLARKAIAGTSQQRRLIRPISARYLGGLSL